VGQNVHLKLQALEGSTNRTYGVVRGTTFDKSVLLGFFLLPIFKLIQES